MTPLCLMTAWLALSGIRTSAADTAVTPTPQPQATQVSEAPSPKTPTPRPKNSAMTPNAPNQTPAPAAAPDHSPPGLETVYLAGGCFWGMEEILRKIPGVRETQAGYTGGWLPNPKYDDTHDSKSGHAESVKVVFDPKTLPFEELLEKWFFRMHDPTTLNRQGNDVGSQYRSAIFTFNETQKKTAETVKARVNASGKWRRPVVTEIATASIWYPAEGYHQKYLLKNPGGYTCHFMRD